MTKAKLVAAAFLGSSLFLASGAVQAAPISGNALAGAKANVQAETDNAAPLVDVRWRRRRYWRHHHHHDDAGAVAAGAIFGLATGAILGSAAANSNAVSYCSRRFRSYDPVSGTYLGYDGYRHPCP